MEDARLEAKVKKLAKSKVIASVKDGIATLTGEVKTWEDVVELGRAVGKLEVREVVNLVTAEADVETEKEEKERLKLPEEAYNPTLPERVDVVIIGGGVVGCAIARELSRYDLDIVLLEKECDVGCGATKANSAQIHTGIGEKSGTLKKELCVRAWPKYEKISEELNIPYKKDGLLIVLTTDTLSIPLFGNFLTRYLVAPIIKRKGKKVGDKPIIIKRKELMEMEPNLTDRALTAVFMPNYGIICPNRFTIALAENAVQNGVRVFLDTEVENIEDMEEKTQKVVTSRGSIETKFIINAAGLFADKIAEMAGSQEFTIHPRKGSIILFDKAYAGHINHQISEMILPQNPYTKGGAVLKTIDGNLNWGPTAVEVPSKSDRSVTGEEIQSILKKFGKIIPDFPKRSVITYFAGLRAPTYKEDFYIVPSKVKGLIHVAGIQSPGLTSAPVIAEIVVEILKDEGLKTRQKNFDPIRKKPIVFDELSINEKKEKIKENSLYGNVVCRCEHITEAEIIGAIHSSPPALTVDAIKRRTRAGMGRCQGGFCGPRVSAIMARELGIPLEKITKCGPGSELYIEKTKSSGDI